MTLFDGFAPPLPCKQCWSLEKLLRQKKLTVSQPTLLEGEGEAQFNSHIGGLIIFVKDCLNFEKDYEGFGLCFFDMFMTSILPD